MNLIRKEMERVWRELPCLSPSHFIRWSIILRIPISIGLKGLSYLNPIPLLNWRPGNLGGKRSTKTPKMDWRKHWRKVK